MSQLSFAGELSVEVGASKIQFSGEHAGEAFSGAFEQYQAVIAVDDETGKLTNIRAIFDTSSAKTGNKMYDGTLPEQDWFDVENHPEAQFVSTDIQADEAAGGYKVVGDLTIKGHSAPVSFDLTLSNPAEPPVRIQGQFEIDRLAYKVGFESDPEAEWVSRGIPVTLDLQAR